MKMIQIKNRESNKNEEYIFRDRQRERECIIHKAQYTGKNIN